MGNFTKRIDEYRNPNASKWRGQSTSPNITRWSERAAKNSDGADHRASSGDVKLPSTGETKVHSTHAKAGHTGDFYEKARRDLNHDTRNPYMPGVRRTGR